MTIRRRSALLGATAGVAGLTGAFLVAMPASTASAHGGLTFPETRTYACYVDGREGGGGGNLDPSNPMCAQAWQESPQGFWDWFGNLLPDSDGQHRQVIADGELCGPGSDFQPFNAAPAGDWPTTELQPGAEITFQYNAWAPHPGTWSQYVTTDDWNPDTPLTWDELEPVPFDEVTDPPLRDGGPEGAEYYWNATLPSGKQGQHIIYSIWERSDSPEAFYNCSDVYFTGDPGGDPGNGDPGNGDPDEDPEPPTTPGDPEVSGVTGTTADLSWGASDGAVENYEVYDSATGDLLATSTSTQTTLTGLTPETDYTVHLVANGAGETSAPSAEVSFTTGSPADTACEVDYELNDWGSGFSADVTIHNESDTTLESWALEWHFHNGETVSQAWNANVGQHEDHIMAQGDEWNGAIPAGGSTSFGFLGEASAGTGVPDDFVLNGLPCTTA